VQPDRGAQQRDDLQLCLEPFYVKVRSLTRSFAAVNREVARINAEPEGREVKFAEFDASTGRPLERRNHVTPYQLMEGVGSDIPAKQSKHRQAEHAKP
jgi:hypothetical protein